MRTKRLIELIYMLCHTFNEQREKRSVSLRFSMISQHMRHNIDDRLTANLPLI
jgi:hypothetical protein